MLHRYDVHWITTPELPSEARDRHHRVEAKASNPHVTGAGSRVLDLARGRIGRRTRLDAGASLEPSITACCA
jgi:hypothetical protein